MPDNWEDYDGRLTRAEWCARLATIAVLCVLAGQVFGVVVPALEDVEERTLVVLGIGRRGDALSRAATVEWRRRREALELAKYIDYCDNLEPKKEECVWLGPRTPLVCEVNEGKERICRDRDSIFQRGEMVVTARDHVEELKLREQRWAETTCRDAASKGRECVRSWPLPIVDCGPRGIDGSRPCVDRRPEEAELRLARPVGWVDWNVVVAAFCSFYLAWRVLAGVTVLRNQQRVTRFLGGEAGLRNLRGLVLETRHQLKDAEGKRWWVPGGRGRVLANHYWGVLTMWSLDVRDKVVGVVKRIARSRDDH